MADPATVTATVAAVPYVLPWWMQWVQVTASSLGVLCVAVFGAFIAYRQVRIASTQAETALTQSRIATAKLNLDLYDRRFKVFEAAKTFLAIIIRDGTISLEDTIAFGIGINDAVFLFESELVAYLEELQQRGAALSANESQLKKLQDGDVRRDRLIDQTAVLEDGLFSEYSRLVDMFKPYLKLGNI